MAVHMDGPVPRPLTEQEAAAVEGLSTTLLSDALNRSGAMDAGIRPVGASVAFVASALTVSVMVGDNRALHHAAALLEPGHVIVVDGNGDMSTALWGEILHRMASRRGLRALVVDGCVRDSAALASTPIPVWSRGCVPRGPHKGWGGSINAAIQCGGIPVMPGDVIVGDRDGIVAIPRGMLAKVSADARTLLIKEQQILAQIDNGLATIDVLPDLRQPERL